MNVFTPYQQILVVLLLSRRIYVLVLYSDACFKLTSNGNEKNS